MIYKNCLFVYKVYFTLVFLLSLKSLKLNTERLLPETMQGKLSNLNNISKITNKCKLHFRGFSQSNHPVNSSYISE